MSGRSLLIERIWPYVGAAAGTAIWFYVAGAKFPEKPDGLLGATGNAVAVLVGFLASSKAIVLSVSASAVFEKLSAAGYSQLLFAYLYEAIAAGMLLLVVSFIGFFFDSSALSIWYKSAWVAISLAALFCFFRVVGILFKLLRHV